jgi:hypothetical protein
MASSPRVRFLSGDLQRSSGKRRSSAEIDPRLRKINKPNHGEYDDDRGDAEAEHKADVVAGGALSGLPRRHDRALLGTLRRILLGTLGRIHDMSSWISDYVSSAFANRSGNGRFGPPANDSAAASPSLQTNGSVEQKVYYGWASSQSSTSLRTISSPKP